MGPVVNTEKLEAEAAAWLVRSEAARFTGRERVALEKRLAADSRLRAAYLRLRAAWQEADQLSRLRSYDGSVNENLLTEVILPSLQRADRVSKTKRARKFAAAAVAALALAGVLALDHLAWQRYATDIGSFQRVTLRDGSAVHMNTDSRIRVRLAEKLRRVRLDRGEALFIVASDERRPFDVEVGDTTIRGAPGTMFSVRLREAKTIDVLVTGGQVTIDPAERETATAAALPASISTLSAGEAVKIVATTLHIAKIDPGQVARRMAWTQGQVSFEREPLAQVVAEFNRYNRRRLEVGDPAIANLPISAGFEATHPEEFLAAVRHMYGVRAFRAGSGEDEVLRLVGTVKR